MAATRKEDANKQYRGLLQPAVLASSTCVRTTGDLAGLASRSKSAVHANTPKLVLFAAIFQWIPAEILANDACGPERGTNRQLNNFIYVQYNWECEYPAGLTSSGSIETDAQAVAFVLAINTDADSCPRPKLTGQQAAQLRPTSRICTEPAVMSLSIDDNCARWLWLPWCAL